jgi:hypothetical protein
LFSLALLTEVDPLKTTTNNIQEVLNVLGVEAALCLLQAELHRVLSFDGSYVDPRHTWLLADTVARSGSINPLNRHKMEEMGASLLQCASFEQTLEVFEHGAAFAKEDTLGGATEKLIVGQPVHVGTGSFGIVSTEQCKPRSTFVAPLQRMETDEFSFVEPLHRPDFVREATSVKHIKTTSTSSLPTLLPSSDVGQQELLPLFACMRKQAQRRQLIIVSGCISSSKEDFLRLEKVLEKLHWIPKPKECQFTDIDYSLDSASVRTRTGLGVISHFTRTVHEQLNFDVPDTQGLFVLSAKAFQQDAVSVNDLPTCVNPVSVSIRHERNFVKGPWTLRLSRVWTADTLVKAEALQMQGSDKATFETEIELSDPWDIMEVRGSSDWALTGAMIERTLFVVLGMLDN